MGLPSTRVDKPMRHDRLLLITAFAVAMLTIPGAIGRSLGMGQRLKSYMSKIRPHSLFRQSCMLYDLISNMPEYRLIPLMDACARAMSKTTEFSEHIIKSE